MERFNPFDSSANPAEDPDPFSTNFNRSTGPEASRAQFLADQREDDATKGISSAGAARPDGANTITGTTNRYSTSFPDPFGDQPETSARGEPAGGSSTSPAIASRTPTMDKNGQVSAAMGSGNSVGSNRSNSVTFSPISHSVDESSTMAPSLGRVGGAGRREMGSGFTSFLSRATSVTSSSVTDRVSGAVGSVRNAVDSLSSQIQQAVPSNLNERISTTANSLIGGSPASSSLDQTSQQPQEQQQQQQPQPQQHQLQQSFSLQSPKTPQSAGQPQQSAASYLANKFSSATGQFTSSGSSSASLPVISRQRVILVLDSFASADWAQQFNQYRRLAAGLGTSTQSALTSFFSSASAQLNLTGSYGSSSNSEGGDLIEQADFRDISVLANQSSSTASIYVARSRPASGSARNSLAPKIIRPEYVVVRQRGRDRLEHMRGIVGALNYCMVPMFESMEIWNVFQDRQQVFAKLLRVQKQLGKENFPLIPQIFCQTHQDLLNYINSPSVRMPCLVRTGPSGKGKIKLENLQALREFASIVATSNLSCTIEQYLDVKCDLIVQKLGTNLKLFRRNIGQQQQANQQLTSGATSDAQSASAQADPPASAGPFSSVMSMSLTTLDSSRPEPSYARQSASRQTSIGSSMLSSLIPGQGQQQQQQQQQLSRKSSNPSLGVFERAGEVSSRYRGWVEAIDHQFGHQMEAFCVKILVASNDREYIVGLADCSMNFLGTLDNQEEDKRSFIELIIGHMNTLLPKNHTALGRESSLGAPVSPSNGGAVRRSSSTSYSGQDGAKSQLQALAAGYQQQAQQSYNYQTPLGDKKKFTSQTQINGGQVSAKENGRNYGQLSSRSQSVSMNQSDYLDPPGIIKSSNLIRRGSDRADSLTNTELTSDDLTYGTQETLATSTTGSLHQRQSSLGQSFLDQTSTAFSSLQKQSLSFFKRLDSRTGDFATTNTPPQSAKSDKGFDRTYLGSSSGAGASLSSTGGANCAMDDGVPGARGGFKSQSMDSSTLDSLTRVKKREAPPKPPPPPPPPPPPHVLPKRQSSLASYSSQRQTSNSAMPNSTPTKSRQNSAAESATGGGGGGGDDLGVSGQRPARVIRQNSALSAFEPFDAELASQSQADRQMRSEQPLAGSAASILAPDKQRKPFETAKRGSNFDSASITSGDSNSTGETTTAEDTMNNLKKTFASIFGDKCE